MKRKHVLTLGSGIAALGVAAFLLFEVSGHKRTDADPRSAPALVRLVAAQSADSQTRSFTGTVKAKIQSNLGVLRCRFNVLLRLKAILHEGSLFRGQTTCLTTLSRVVA